MVQLNNFKIQRKSRNDFCSQYHFDLSKEKTEQNAPPSTRISTFSRASTYPTSLVIRVNPLQHFSIPHAHMAAFTVYCDPVVLRLLYNFLVLLYLNWKPLWCHQCWNISWFFARFRAEKKQSKLHWDLRKKNQIKTLIQLNKLHWDAGYAVELPKQINKKLVSVQPYFPLFWKSHCVICVPVWFIPCHVTGSCIAPILPFYWEPCDWYNVGLLAI